MSPQVDPQTPAWMLDLVDGVLQTGESRLIDRMLDDDEDITDTPLWVHRRSQFRSLLAEKLAEA